MTAQLDMNRIPRHIAFIMDGNGRWAAERGQERLYGHNAGVETVRRITTECGNLGVKYVTLYTFSTENWNRPADEVAGLMHLLLTSLEDDIFMRNNARMIIIGDRSRLPQDVREGLEGVEKRTANNTRMDVLIALSYSSKWEITEAVKNIAEEVKNGTLKSEDIDEEVISQHLETKGVPDPDLLIRTGGEVRVSNFLLWQIAYSELYFCDTYWPDFREEDLHKAIISYQGRQRRYGKTEAQIENEEK